VNPGVPQAWGPHAAPTRIINNVFIANRDNSYYRTKSTTSEGGATHQPYGLGNPTITWHGFTPAEFERNVIVVDATDGEWVL
jgi:hypothetical protein